MPQSFRVVLRDAEGFEGLDSRRFNLSVGSTFPIGRASRNTTKKELMPAEHNAFIDSPVISRDHAVLSASTENELPKVFIADSGSMHGTIVNGQRLTANVPQQLSSGDTIQFGIDVNRNEEFFVARKYTFEAELMPPQTPFSLGFTVPEPESEEEDITGTSPHRGSQNNPLTIDESDSEPDASDNEQPETTMIGHGFIVDEDDESTAACGFDLPHEAVGESSDDEESLGDYPSDIDIQPDESMDSQASIMGDSVVDYSSDMELSDVENEDGSETVDQQTTSGSELPLQEQTVVPNLPAWVTQDSGASFNPMQPYIGSLPPMMMAHNNDMSSFGPPPPLSPRPSATRPPFFVRDEDTYSQKPSWLPDHEANTFSNFLGTNHGDHPSLFSPAPISTMPGSQEAERTSSMFDNNSADFVPINSNRLQTPPPMPLSDVTTSTPPPPSRRTKVSITEIVEEQPPTPSSVNEMKRKADVFEEEEVITLEEHVVAQAEVVVPAIEATTVGAPAEVVAVQTDAIIAQRPKKQPRSIMGKLRNTATVLGYSAVGAAGALAMLTVLPDAFFA